MRKMMDVPIDEIDANDLSVNVEDTATFNRLKEELRKRGMIELPVLCKRDGGYVVYSGHHRVRAWQVLGYTSVPAIVYADGDLPFVSKEDEFNGVNNMNRVRGEFSPTRARQVIARHKLDLTKLDIFKFRFPSMDENEVAKKVSEEMERKRKLLEIANRIATEIAADIVNGVNQPVLVLLTENDRIAVLTRVQSIDGTVARKYAPKIVEAIKSVVPWEASADTEQDGQSLKEGVDVGSETNDA